MAKEGTGEPLMIRLPTDVLKRADALRSKLAREPELAAMGRVSRSAVLRLAILKGLETLEARYR